MLKIEFSNLAKVLLWEEAPEAFSSGALRMCTGKEKIGSAERWMDIVVKLDTKAVSLENTQLHVKVKGMDSEKVLSEIKTPAVTPDALVRLDMRGLNKEHANLHVEWRASDGKILGIGEIWVSAEPATPLARGTRIPVKLDLPKGTEKIEKYPVRFGLPLPRGALWEAKGLKVVDPAGREIPSQLETAGRWAEEGSVKWLWVDAIVSAKTGDTIYVESGIRSTLSLPVMPVKVEEKGNMLLVNTGVAEYTVGRDGGLIKEVRCANRIIAREGNLRGLYVVDQKGRVGKASATGSSMEIESDGPVSAVVKIEGFYKTEQGEELARHITRLKFGAGRQEAEVTHTLILTRNTNEVWFRDIGWEFDVSAGADAKALFSIIPGDFRSPADGKISMKGTWGVETAKAEEVPVKEKNISIPLSGQKICSVVQKEGISLGLKPFNIPLWNHATKPATGWAPYLHGKPLLEVKEEGKEGVVYEGENMGDWFAVEGRNGGLMISCRDAAAQHPKEFEVSGNRLNFKLFSSASGKELDFRMESLMKNWGMLPLEKVDSYDKVPRKLLEGYLGFISKHESNAIGWAKTHEMLFAPSSSSVLPVWSLLHSRQVFAHVSPSWIRETRAMGTMHPKDIQNFPHDETLIENLFWGKVKQGDGGPVGGFVDYNAGPHWIIHSWRSGSYTIRSDSWYLYARSADRSIREFAEGANRAFLDNNMAHWNSPGKIPGLLLGGSSGPGDRGDRTRKCDLPMYWETTADSYEQATVANYDQALLDYYITGSRRSGDIMASFARAIKENLTTSVKHWRVILAVRHISQAYEFSWDPKIKELIYEIIDRSIYDPESPVLLTKARPHRSSTYKMETDGDVLVELYELFGDRLFHKMAMAIAQYNWDKEAINPPKSPSQNRSSGMLGYFLWEQTKNPSVAARFEYGKRRLVGDRLSDPENGGLKLTCVSQIPRYFKGLPYAMD
ncbi:MAG TPA: hypothetical protein PKN36_04680, partial [bacterium]|nr:hypothetical protein [bacterium]